MIINKEELHMLIATLVLAAALNPGGLVLWLILGLIAGFLASRIMGAGGYGLVGDIIVGIIGAFIGGLLANLLIPDANFGFWGSLIVAIIGACILIAILRAVRHA
jgi:uncharacterized membrane protein YeaQ/YmgE (transglycosylase-associated protein family)